MCESCEQSASLVDVLSGINNQLRRIANALERSTEVVESERNRNDALLEEFRPFINAGKKKMLEAIAEDYLGTLVK